MNAGGPVPGGTVSSLPQGSQMTRQARRLYVGNIPFGITEVQLEIKSSELNFYLIHTKY